ncbi:GAF and ANTAR domain-containing protein [Leifsonia sp. YIM 134122]|uniref:GAF and ANTAR domain-containing protein n=1 Tax=Leifsonia stereocauli TaxID=3134136 RepID=A0ABU9W3Y7_9MICO
MESNPAGADSPDAPHGRDFAVAAARLTAAVGPDDDLCAPLVCATATSGAVISSLGEPLGTQTICASSVIAERIDEIQIDLGEGPCWEAFRSRVPVMENDVQHASGGDWPTALESLQGLGIGALYAFPLYVGDLSVGSLDLYSMKARRLSAPQVHDATALASIAARQVLRRALDGLDLPMDEPVAGRYSRREVYQASGMVAAQMSISVDDALLVIRGHAFAEDRTVREVAAEIVNRNLTFGSAER